MHEYDGKWIDRPPKPARSNSTLILMDVTFSSNPFGPLNVSSLIPASPFPRLAVPPYTHRPFHLSFLWGRFRLPRLTWMHLSGYSRPSFVSFWTGTMPSLLLSFSPCQFIPLFLPPPRPPLPLLWREGRPSGKTALTWNHPLLLPSRIPAELLFHHSLPTRKPVIYSRQSIPRWKREPEIFGTSLWVMLRYGRICLENLH